MSFKKILFLFVLSLFFTRSYSQIEYKLYVGIAGNYNLGEEITYNYRGIDYIMSINAANGGAFIGYNINQNLSAELNISTHANAQGTYITNDYRTSKIVLSYNFFPIKKLSPFIASSININSVRLYMTRYFLLNTNIEKSDSHYSTKYNSLGCSLGGGLRLKLGIKFEIIPYYYQNFYSKLFNYSTWGVALKYNFLTKKH